ncbi:MAG TPA: NAD(P)-dependent oxidoreductase [Chloroflexota bacterium]|nr:NAD(P)-dependent oxidoreductase [Chloroflexota bacterium]
MRRRLLLTGATGYIASQMLPTLRERYDLVLCDVRETDREGRPVEGVQIADLADPDLEGKRHLFEGVEAVVHLAYNRRGHDPDRDYFDERVNVDMAYNVYKLTQRAGGRRVVMASSNHAADFWEYPIWQRRIDMISPDAPRPLSDNFYGWAKEAYEHLGFVFASGGGGRPIVEVVQIRIGAPRPIRAESFFNAERNDPVAYTRDLGAYISPRDLTQLFVKAVEAEDVRNEWGVPFQVFYGISGNTRAFWSIANARRVIGYQPEDDSEHAFRDEIVRYLGRSPFAGPLVQGANRRGGC